MRPEAELGKILTEKKLTISLAESLTGGAISAEIIKVPRASLYFTGGVIAYDNRIKMRLLKVRPETLRKKGAVSEACAEEMAEGIRDLMKTDIGVSVTGIAGPGGATAKKPAGLVYAGFNVRGDICVRKYRFRGTRKIIIRKTVLETLKELNRIVSPRRTRLEARKAKRDSLPA